jgi:hypothetical protein
MSINKEIYLINNGLSCQEIYKFLVDNYLLKKKEGLIINTSNKKILNDLKKEKKNKLSLNGIIETRELKKNKKMIELKDSSNVFFSLCDRTSIETGLIFLNNEIRHNFTLSVLPLIKYSNIKKSNEIPEFINSFTSDNNNMKQYWKINNNIINNKNNVDLNWTEINSRSFDEIKNFTIDKLLTLISDQRKYIHERSKLIIFCNDTIIKKMVELIKNEKYKPIKSMKIYNTHCIKLTLTHDTVINDIKYNEFSTIYPKELSPEPLFLKNDNFIYKFKGNEYKLLCKYLFKKSKFLYKDEFKIIEECRCYQEDKVKKILKILNNDIHNKNKNSKKITNFDDVFNKFNNL